MIAIYSHIQDALCCRQPEHNAHKTICENTVNAIFIPDTTYHIPYTIYQNGPTDQNIMNIFLGKQH